MPAPARRCALVVLGMHRGGTSAVAGMLHRLGVDFGPRLMPANADNPAGYYEHNDVVNLHDRFLGRLGAAWDDPFPPEFDPGVWPDLAPAPGLPTYRQELLAILQRDFAGQGNDRPAAAPVWGLKDPRLCLLLPWWAPQWASLDSEPRFIIVLRSPDAVAASLGRRDGFSPVKSQLLWLQHLLRAERDTRGHRRCFLDYDDFLTDWRGTLDRVRATLGVTWPRPPGSLTPAEAAFIDPVLRHHRAAPGQDAAVGEASGVRLPWVETAQTALPPDGPGNVATLDALQKEIHRAQRVFSTLWEHQEVDVVRQLHAHRRLTRWYEEEWQKSISERVTLESRLDKKDDKILSLRDRLAKNQPPNAQK